MKLPLTLCATAAIIALTASQDFPKQGYVPNSETAVIAEALLIPISGRKHIESKRPFRATIKDDVWTVAGTPILRRRQASDGQGADM
jgi:hypothetical protein